jgi:hypothetical protein
MLAAHATASKTRISSSFGVAVRPLHSFPWGDDPPLACFRQQNSSA